MTLHSLYRFFKTDIWHVKRADHNAVSYFFLDMIRVLILAGRSFLDARIMRKASALAFASMLAIVPMLAVVFAIARGFGFSKHIEEWFYDLMSSQPQVAETIVGFVNSYLVNVKSGVILGVGLLVMLYTVIMLIISVEGTFNDIWHVNDSRGVMSTVVDYVAFIVLLPVLIILTSGMSIFVTTTSGHLGEFVAPVVRFAFAFSPYVVWSVVFIIIYKTLPFTKVNFSSVILPGIVAGVAMQLLQHFYIIFQMRVTSYNAIYGSFAALPLFMLWLQFSWIICLVGVHLCYTNQNMEQLTPLSHNDHIAHDHQLRLAAMVLSCVCRNFEEGGEALTALELKHKTGIPTHIVSNLLEMMERVRLVVDASGGNRDKTPAFMPAIDTSHLTVGMMVERLESGGSWTFDEVPPEVFGQEHWKKIEELRARYLSDLSGVRVSDLEIS